MHFTKTLAVVAFLATSVLAAPAPNPPPPPPKTQPTKPAKPTPTTVVQTNQCGNGASPYCCNTDNLGKYTTCKTMSNGDTCSATTICCNANNSIQVCLGDVTIL